MENKNELIDYWLKSSDYDFEASCDLFSSGKYPHALFFGHLAVEKALKALYVGALDDYPPRTHNLVMLTKGIGLEIDEKRLNDMIEINTFNMEARYPDEKFDFYRKCTVHFAEEKMTVIRELLKWLKEKL